MSIKNAVLETLQKNKGQYMSGEELSESLGVTRAAIWKAINTLRQEGFPIEAAPRKGYYLPVSQTLVTKEQVLSALPAPLRSNNIMVYDVLDSTNLRAKQLILDGEASHGAVVIASQQTAGRGRLGRSFFSPKEGLYLSIVIRPEFDMNMASLVTVAAASAVADSIEAVCNIDAQIKWVNDIFVDGKKVCGILTEAISDFESGQIGNIVIGIGINTSTNGFPEELQEIAGAISGDYSRSALVASIVAKTIENIEELNTDSFAKEPEFLSSYRSHSMLIGSNITVYKGVYRRDPSVECDGISARAVGIDSKGGLEVIYSNGERETLTSGEVSVRKDKK